MKALKITSILTAVIIASGINSQLHAQELTGRDIVEKVYNLPTGGDQTSDLTMTLINKSGKERIRKIKQFTKDMGDMEKSIMFFQSPADVKNTSFMNWTYDDESKSDDQWIYLPALKKVKRISSDSKSDYFMGSDF
ncbi:MAG: outer membrane lipoprotein-sorting protein, partial [Bacteroidetes bacterium]